MDPLRITVEDIELEATWTEDNPSTRDAIATALPVEGEARRWGDELYLPIQVETTPSTTREHVPRGGVAYWPDGPALCVFWGPTPASTDERPRAASPVAMLATIDEYSPLETIEGGARLRFEDQSNVST